MTACCTGRGTGRQKVHDPQAIGLFGMTPSNQSAVPLVLLVDDDADSREMYAQALAWSGYRTAEAGGADEALSIATRLKPDILVTDLVLPGIDGIELAQRLRATPGLAEMPVIAVTGLAQPPAAGAAGFSAVLTKPCSPDALVQRIASLLDVRISPDATGPQ